VQPHLVLGADGGDLGDGSTLAVEVVPTVATTASGL
jgi:hypothetical protein